MLYALIETGIRPDVIVGTSVGALNGAYLAGHADLEGIQGLAGLWTSKHRRDVFPVSIVDLVRGLLGMRNSLFKSGGLRRIITKSLLGFSNLEDAPIHLHVVATDLLASKPIVLSEGPVVEALLASTAIPGIFPPVERDGHMLVDGGVLANVPIRQAEALRASRIYVLPTIADGVRSRPTSALVMMQRAISLTSEPCARLALEGARSRTRVHVVPVPERAARLSAFDFRSTGQLIEDAYEVTSSWIRHYHVRATEPEPRLVAR
jgi:NTE family protein